MKLCEAFAIAKTPSSSRSNDVTSVDLFVQPSNSNMELLHGVKACRPTNIISTNWLSKFMIMCNSEHLSCNRSS